jgi:hypothetical protein
MYAYVQWGADLGESQTVKRGREKRTVGRKGERKRELALDNGVGGVAFVRNENEI